MALRNIASFRPQFELFDTFYGGYFYNPFSVVVLAAILQRIQVSLATQPRDLLVCDTLPCAHAPLDQAPFLRLVQAHAYYRIHRAV